MTTDLLIIPETESSAQNELQIMPIDPVELQNYWRTELIEAGQAYRRSIDISITNLMDAARALRRGRYACERNGTPAMLWYRDHCGGASQGHVSRLLKALSVWEEAGDAQREFLTLMNRDALYSLLYAPHGTLEAAMTEYDRSKPAAVNRALIERVKDTMKASKAPVDMIAALADQAVDAARELRRNDAEMLKTKKELADMQAQRDVIAAALEAAKEDVNALRQDVDNAKDRADALARTSSEKSKTPKIGEVEQKRVEELKRDLEALDVKRRNMQAGLRKIEQSLQGVEEIESAITTFIQDIAVDTINDTIDGMAPEDTVRVKKAITRLIAHAKALGSFV